MELDGLPSTVMLPLALTLTYDLLTPKSNHHIYEPEYTCNQNWVKFPSLVFLPREHMRGRSWES